MKRAISDPAVDKGTTAMSLAVSKGMILPLAETGKDGEEERGEADRGAGSCCDGAAASRKDEAQTAIL